MKGHVTLKKFNSEKFSDMDYLQAKKEGCILDLLSSLDVRDEYESDNQIHHLIVPTFFYNGGATYGFQGATTINQYTEANAGVLYCIKLTSDSSIYAYNWGEWGFVPIESGFNGVGSGSAKRFVEDDVVDYVISTPYPGKNEAVFSSKFLFYPTQAVSSVIRTVKIETAASDLQRTIPNNHDMATIASWRIRDGGGNPVTISKLITESLLLQYDLIFTSH